ncbi:MAG TPA: restriction endonuclease [Clostridiales bacterium]|nr:restriction endonuclease [Clostridiales bacterium]
MRPSSLRDKLLELYAEQEVAAQEEYDIDAVKRCVINYLRKKYDNNKIQRVIDDMYSRYDLTADSKEIRRRNQLTEYIDSIVMSRIRDSYKSSKILDIDSLDELKFKALVKQVIGHFGYETLFVPVNSLNNIDIIVHRKDIKIAVLAIKGEPGSIIGLKTIRRLRYIANYYHCEQALLITNTFFDSEAFNEAAEIGITLLDRDKLVPLVKDLIDGRQKEDKEFLIDDIEDQKNSIFLEGEIKFPKTKVQVVFVKYYIDNDTNYLTFEGKLVNTGKKPASNISVEIKLFNRNNDSIYSKSFPIEKEKLESKEEAAFKFYFNEIPQHDWENLCRYQLKLEYKNTYKE